MERSDKESSSGKKIGLLGGTFDPIHHTHLYIANAVKEACSLDEIWFVPAKQPPHKQKQQVTSEQDRIAMVQAAIKPVEYFKLSLIECEREGPSYTFETVSILKKRYPEHSFSFIIGADMIDYLPRWHKIDELVQIISFIGVGRPGWSLDPGHPYAKYVTKVETVQSNLSSTQIREVKEQGQSIRFLVPDQVYCYIEEKGLYAKKI